jgi:hypothetical protein
VFFWEGMSGEGKVDSWGSLADHALRRKTLRQRKDRFLDESLSDLEIQRINELSMSLRDDSTGSKPGSARSDEEERLFMASVSEEDRCFFRSQQGLGDSQKAEVAWLERMGYDYEEVDVRAAFGMGGS